MILSPAVHICRRFFDRTGYLPFTIIRDNDVRSVTVVRMEVPCCGGLQRAAENALRSSGKFIPWQVVTISRDGRILD